MRKNGFPKPISGVQRCTFTEEAGRVEVSMNRIGPFSKNTNALKKVIVATPSSPPYDQFLPLIASKADLLDTMFKLCFCRLSYFTSRAQTRQTDLGGSKKRSAAFDLMFVTIFIPVEL